MNEQVIYKYELKFDTHMEPQRIEMPKGANILDVQTQASRIQYGQLSTLISLLKIGFLKYLAPVILFLSILDCVNISLAFKKMDMCGTFSNIFPFN